MAHARYRCYAKINLTLEILGKRDDGYHELASLVHTVSLADDLRIESADELLSHVEGLDIDVGTNLVNRAARLLAATAHVPPRAELTLVKRIPTAAGLGGGSSDAASTLVGLNSLWGTRLGIEVLSKLAAELGSDVPFFVRGGAALMRGRGEDLEALRALSGQWLLIVVPTHEVTHKTSHLYAALQPGDFSNGDASTRAASCLQQRRPLNPTDLVNAFARAAHAVFPRLSETWTALERTCQKRFYLSGAGPALFAFADDSADARRQQTSVTRLGLAAYAARTVPHARTSVRFAARSSIGYP